MTSTLTRNQQNPIVASNSKPASSPRATPEPVSTRPAAESSPRPSVDAHYLAHDARNWLTVLQVYCDLLKTCDADTPPTRGGMRPSRVPAQNSQRRHPDGHKYSMRENSIHPDQRRQWIEELATAVERGHGLVASLLDSIEGSESRREPQQPSSPKDGREPLAALGAPGPDVAARRSTNQHSYNQRASDTRTAEQPSAKQPSADRRSTDRHCTDRRWPASVVVTPAVPPLDLADAVRRRIPVLQRLAGTHIHVEADAPDTSGKAALAETDFERILHNLVLNAIEAMPNGGRLRIVLRSGNRSAGSPAGTTAKRPGDRRASTGSNQGSRKASSRTVLLRVYDTGDGIPRERLPDIFQAGVSGKPERAERHQRRGFGLASVRELTERAGGAVRVRSHPGKGSCFEIELPRV